MINFDKLDKNKTYIGLQYGSKSLIAKLIRRCTKIYAKDCEDLPTHVLAFVYEGDWKIYESHLERQEKFCIDSGTRCIDLSTWKEIEEKSLSSFKAYPAKLSIYQLKKNLFKPYGVEDIKNLLRVWILRNNGTQKDGKGLICSEYIALAYPEICKYFKLPAYCITPAHFEKFLKDKNIKAFDSEE